MADPPRKSMPEPCWFFDSVTNSFFGREDILDHVWDEAMSREAGSEVALEIPSVSEVAGKTSSSVSDHSMSAEELDDDDLLDDEEEYSKEMDDQRLVDARNGHFEDKQWSPTKLPAMAETTAMEEEASIACNFWVSHSSSLNLDSSNKGGECLEEREGAATCHSSIALGNLQAASPFNEGTGLAADWEGRQAAIIGNGVSPNSGDSRLNSSKREALEFENPLIAANIPPISMMNEDEFNAVATSHTDLHANLGNNPTGMEEDRLPAIWAEENNCLDLVEARTLVNQQGGSGFFRGPPNSPFPAAPAQVSSLLDPLLFPTTGPIKPQPNLILHNQPPSTQPKPKTNNTPPLPIIKHRPRLPNKFPQPKNLQLKPKSLAQIKKKKKRLPRPPSHSQIRAPLPPVRSWQPPFSSAGNIPAMPKKSPPQTPILV